MPTAQTLVIATRNQGKAREIQALLQDFPVTIKDLSAFGPLPEIEEDGSTFEENAYKKASLTARMLGLPALADDSGLVVEALNGAPGVYSARFGGAGLNDEQRCQRLLAALQSKADRRASFECVISIAVPAGPALTYEARCEGLIADAASGDGGFGYDPIFFYPPYSKTFGQMSIDEKSQVSHRGKALMEVKQEFDKIIKWLQMHF
jgi:XTP/dITP diphosphohydrolase